MTFAEMVAAAEDDLGYAQPSTAQTTRIKRWINEGYRHLLSQPGREKMRDATITITTVANQASYAMPMECAEIYRLIQVDNQQPVTGMTMDEYRLVNPGLDQSSNFAYRYIPFGWAPVLRQPGGTGLWATGDITASMNVGGYLTNGDIATPITVPLVDVPRTRLGTLSTWNLLNRLNLSATSVNVMSVYDAATGGNELLRLQPGQTSAQYFHIILFPTPSDAGIVYTADVRLALADMVNDNDIPLLPPDFHDILPLYARMRDYMRAGADPRYPVARDEWTRRGLDLARVIDWGKDFNPVMCNLGGYGFSNLGGWFPADFIVGGYRG